MLDVAEAAELLRVSKRTVCRMFRSGELDSVRARSRSIRIPLLPSRRTSRLTDGQSGDAA